VKQKDWKENGGAEWKKGCLEVEKKCFFLSG